MSNNELNISWSKEKRISKNRRCKTSQLRDAGKEHQTLVSKKKKPAKVQPLNMVSFHSFNNVSLLSLSIQKFSKTFSFRFFFRRDVNAPIIAKNLVKCK